MRVLGIDIGSARVGVAVGDTSVGVASASEVLSAKDQPVMIRSLARCVEDWEAERVIIGLPRSLDGSEGPAALRVRRIASEIAASLSVPIEFHDERFSTVSAQQALHATGVSTRKGRKVIDAVAAAVILQNWLDANIEHST